MKSCISYTLFGIGSEKVIELQICCHSGTKGKSDSLDANQKLIPSVLTKKRVLRRGFN